MFDYMAGSLRPRLSELRRARDEFRELLSRPTKEPLWQQFFTENPYVLSMGLPLRLEPGDVFPMGAQEDQSQAS